MKEDINIAAKALSLSPSITVHSTYQFDVWVM